MSERYLIREVRAGDEGRLARFYARIGADQAVTGFFHPHPFTEEHARWVCGRGPEGRDVYLVAVEGPKEEVTGYAMLRGWDEGYDVPAFGVCVRPDRQGEGLGGRLLDHAVDVACSRGCGRMMLKVHRDNAVARRLYEDRGFVFERDEGDQRVGYRDLSCG